MASPAVWQDARARIQAVATAHSLVVAWPNEASEEPEAAEDGTLPAFLVAEIEADASEPYELGAGVWLEEGTVWVSVIIPTGYGIDDGLTLRKEVSEAFRGVLGPVTYDRFTFPRGGQDEGTGNWYRLQLGISYRFQTS